MCNITPPEGSSPKQAIEWIKARIKEEEHKPNAEVDPACGKTAIECIGLLEEALKLERAREAIPTPEDEPPKPRKGAKP